MSDYPYDYDYEPAPGPSTAQRRVKRKKNKNKAILRLMILIVMIFLAYVLIRFTVGLFQLGAMKADINDLSQQTVDMQASLKKLTTQVEQLQSESYIEEQARAMGMVKEGENQIVTEPTPTAPASTNTVNNETQTTGQNTEQGTNQDTTNNQEANSGNNSTDTSNQ